MCCHHRLHADPRLTLAHTMGAEALERPNGQNEAAAKQPRGPCQGGASGRDENGQLAALATGSTVEEEGSTGTVSVYALGSTGTSAGFRGCSSR